MKRPDELIEGLNGTLQRQVVEYIAWLEGFQKGAREAAEWWSKFAKQPSKRKPYTVDPRLSCGHCHYSQQINSPEGADKRYLIVCLHPKAAEVMPDHPLLVAQHRSFGCGPKAVLWTAKKEVKPEQENPDG